MERSLRTAGACLFSTLLATAIIAAATAPAMASPSRQWVRQLGSTNNDQIGEVATDAAGNAYLAGWTEGSLGGPNRGSYDAWLAKFDGSGRLLWRRQQGTEADDLAYGVATDVGGNVYLAGATGGLLASSNQGGGDAWVAKYDGTGHLLWKRQFGTTKYDTAYGIATDSASNVYLTGTSEGSLGGTNLGSNDGWLAKLDATGTLLWKRQIGTADYDEAFGVATDAVGNVYIVGRTNGSLGGPSQGGIYDAWVAKFDAFGRVLWKRQLGTTGDDQAFRIATDTTGNVFLTGWTDGSLGGPNHGGGDLDGWLAKLDPTGNVLWKRQPGTTTTDLAVDVGTDAPGNVYVVGTTQGSLGGPFKGGFGDAWIAKYDPTGLLVWTRQLGTNLSDWGYSVATDTLGHVFLAGYTQGSLCGNNRGGTDPFVAKYSTAP